VKPFLGELEMLPNSQKKPNIGMLLTVLLIIAWLGLPAQAATIVVTNTHDAGAGSLREAITLANAGVGADTIVFQIPVSDSSFVDVDSGLEGGDLGPDVFVIKPLSPLPSLIGGGTTIDGLTQTDFGGDTNPFGPEIVLDGSLTGSLVNGLTILSDDNEVFSLNIQLFGLNSSDYGGCGIYIKNGNNNWIAGNYIGTDATGTVAHGNGGDGVSIRYGSQQNRIGTNGDGVTDVTERNIISANQWHGVTIRDSGTDLNVVAGNFIGTDMTGTVALGNGGVGVVIWVGAQFNTIGTSGDGVADAAERNIVSGNQSHGVTIRDSGTDLNVVAGNFIGTDVTGTLAFGNGGFGVSIWNGAQFNTIGTNGDGVADAAERNIVSGNQHGVVISSSGTAQNVVAGNFVGTDVTGTIALGNRGRGVEIWDSAQFNTIGTNGDGVADAAERNIVSGNQSHGLTIRDSGTDNNVVAGNFIGTDVTGTVALGNGGDGVDIWLGAQFNTIGTNGDGVADAAERNIISGNQSFGVVIRDSGTDLNVVAGNFIGTDMTGAISLGNLGSGVFVNMGAQQNRIGTNGDGVSDIFECNIISGNMKSGVSIHNAGTEHNVVSGNFIGTDVTGTIAMGNSYNGVSIRYGSQQNRIGTDSDGVSDVEEGNVIAFNVAGVAVIDVDSTGNRIQGNSIHSNAGLGIDLGSDGVTPNDPADADTGPNNYQNTPLISYFETGTVTRIVGTLNSLPNTTFTLDFYANSTLDPSGFGEGERHLGSVDLMTNSSGDADFDISLAAATAVGEVITATATDPSGDTSEYSGVGCTPDPVELLLALAQKVIELNLHNGIENSLDAKLDAALKALQDIKSNNDTAAINTLEAFISTAEAQSGDKIPEADADELIAAALQIIGILSSE
jgi:titin